MARPSQPPAYPTTNSTTRDFAIPSVPSQRSSAQRLQHSIHNNLSFDNSFTSTDIPSQRSIESKGSQLSAQQLLPDSGASFIDSDCLDLQQHPSELLQDLTQDLIPYTSIRHESKVSPHEPWSSFDVVKSSMRSQSEHTLPTLQQNNKRPPTDSGYASSRISRQLVPINIRQSISFESPPGFTYDEPLGSAEQQNLILPDQQRQPTSVETSIERSQASINITADLATGPGTQSSTQSFRCDQCDSEVFHTKSELSKHMARHNKKYICDYPACPRATDGFATKNDLDRHKSSVHHDSTVPRREYRCCVPGCKDPNKLWDRKDNFKAHVKRMHPDADADAIVDQSFQRASQPSTDRASSQTGSQVQDYNPSAYLQPPTNVQPQTPMTSHPYNPYLYSEAEETWPREGDLYDGSTPLTRAPIQSPLATSPYDQPAYIQNTVFPSATTAGPSIDPSSHTMFASTLQEPIMHHREMMTPFLYPPGMIRPVGPNTAPNPGQITDDFNSQPYPWTQSSTTPLMIDNSMSTVDQTTQSGSWLQTTSPGYTPQADIIEQLQPSINLAMEEQASSGADTDPRRDELRQRLMAILKPLSIEEMRIMVQAYEKHPPVPNKDTCAVKSALDAVKAHHGTDDKQFRCTREGCSKAFTQNNIRKKHEKRHDRLFFCTFDGCYSTFGSKDDLRRHESRKHAPNEFQGWRCFADDVPTSQHRPECFKFFDDEEKFKQHRREEHRERAAVNNGGLKAMKQCHVLLGRPGHFWCGFCNKVIQNEPNGTDGTKLDKFRYDHIDQHVTKEQLTMRQWVDLKSEGLTKLEAKPQDVPQAEPPLNDESDDEEDMDQSSPELSTTITGSIPHVQAPSSRAQVMHKNGRGMKRALSVVDHPLPGHASKHLKTFHHAGPRQALSTAPTGQIVSGSGSAHRQVPQVAWVQCCLCANKRHVSSTICGNQGCFHQRCVNCMLLDNYGARWRQTGSTQRGGT